MTLDEAFEELMNSEDFKEQLKQRNSAGGKLRSYISRYRSGNLTTGSVVDILLANGYTISATKDVRKGKGTEDK